MGWVGLIDDSGSRMAWLRDIVCPTYQLVYGPRVSTWTPRVREMKREQGPADLILYDHDLGIGAFEDVDGNTGMEALVETAEMASRLLIWTTNPEAQKRMIGWCKGRHLRAEALAFGPESLRALEAIVRGHLPMLRQGGH
jgi:hypothetical protein